MESTSRVVLITGAAGNLGRAVTQAFAADGDQLVLVDLQTERLTSTFGSIRAGHLLVVANLREQSGADAAVKAALDRFGRVDVLCNVAGGFRMGEPVHEMSDATWDLMLGLNAGTLLHMARAVIPHMLAQGRGSVVNVAAVAAQRGCLHMGAYSAAKSAVIRLTEAMAAELRPRGINVNCVLPSIIDTPENRSAMPDADPTQWVAPEDLASVIRFLASSAARAVHGAAVPVSGLS